MRSIPIFALVLFLQAPAGLPAQGGEDPLPSPVLKPQDIQKLNKLLRDWFNEALKINEYDNKIREKGRKITKAQKSKLGKLQSSARKKKKKFEEEFKKRSDKTGDLLKHVSDLLAITDGCFTYPSQSNGGKVRAFKVKIGRKGLLTYALRFPKTYKSKKNWPLIYSLPHKKGEKWVKGGEYLNEAYPPANVKALEDYIVACPNLEKGMDLSKVVDVQKDSDEDEEASLRSLFFRILGNIFNQFRIDTDRVFLEASGDSVPFALRMASLFPDRFAGLILKNPGNTQNLVPENLSNMSIAVLHDDATKEQAKCLKKALARCEVKEVSEDLPFQASSEWITQWTETVRRNLFTKRVLLVPASDIFKKGYWIEITRSELLSQIPLAERPRVEATVEREANKITIRARNVSEVKLLLNDILVDLDKEITLDLNGKIQTFTRRRSRNLIWNTSTGLVVNRNDPKFLFLTTGVYAVPEPEEAGSGKGGGNGSEKGGEGGKGG